MKIKLTLLDLQENLVKILNIQMGRFDGSLFAMEKTVLNEGEEGESVKVSWDALFIVGIAALLKT